MSFQTSETVWFIKKTPVFLSFFYQDICKLFSYTCLSVFRQIRYQTIRKKPRFHHKAKPRKINNTKYEKSIMLLSNYNTKVNCQAKTHKGKMPEFYIKTPENFWGKIWFYRINFLFSNVYFPRVATITALMVCNLFSASSKTIDCSLSNTSSVTSIALMPNF